MTVQQLNCFFILLWVLNASLGCATTDVDRSDCEPEQRLFGKWYLQQVYFLDEPELRSRDQLWVHFHTNGFVTSSKDPEKLIYRVDPCDMTITIVAGDDEEVARFETDGNTLLLSIPEDNQYYPDNLPVYEYTRTPAGSFTYRAVNKLKRYKPIKSDDQASDQNLMTISQALYDYRSQHDGLPPKQLGELVLVGELPMASLFAPWSNTELPEDFDDSSDQRKARVLGVLSSYLYLYDSYDSENPDQKIVVFELHEHGMLFDTVGVIFGDGRVQRLTREDADNRLMKQTGHPTSDWIESYR